MLNSAYLSQCTIQFGKAFYVFFFTFFLNYWLLQWFMVRKTARIFCVYFFKIYIFLLGWGIYSLLLLWAWFFFLTVLTSERWRTELAISSLWPCDVNGNLRKYQQTEKKKKNALKAHKWIKHNGNGKYGNHPHTKKKKKKSLKKILRLKWQDNSKRLAQLYLHYINHAIKTVYLTSSHLFFLKTLMNPLVLYESECNHWHILVSVTSGYCFGVVFWELLCAFETFFCFGMIS